MIVVVIIIDVFVFVCVFFSLFLLRPPRLRNYAMVQFGVIDLKLHSISRA